MSVRRLLTVLSTVVLAVTAFVVTASDANAWPPGTVASATINKTVFEVGDIAIVTVQNAQPHGVLTMTLYGPEKVLRTGVKLSRTGGATISGRIPSGYVGSHTLQVSSSLGEIFPFSVRIVGPPDSVPPGPVTGLTATTTGSAATLSWTPPADPDVASVRIFRATGPTPPPYGTGQVGSTSDTSFTDTNLDGRTTYSWSVFAVDYSGNVSPAATVTATTARGTDVLTWGSPAVVDPFLGRPGSVSCPTTTFCLAGDGQGNVSRWNGTTWSAPEHRFEVPGLGTDVAVSCASTTMCVALDDTYGRPQVFDGSTWTEQPSLSFTPHAVSCLTATFCVAVGENGRWATYDGATWTEGNGQAGGELDSVSCASTTRCLALDENGAAWVFDGTSFASLPAGFDGAFLAVACAPNSTFCMGAGGAGSTQVLRATNVWAARTTIPGGFVDALTCVSSKFCAVAKHGDVSATFDGARWQDTGPLDAPTGWEGTQPADAISCVNRAFCATAGAGYFRAFQGTGLPYTVGLADPLQGGVSDVSCTADGFCLAVDQQLTWSSRDAGGTWSTPKLDGQLLTRPVLSCVSRTWCLAVRSDGAAARWNGTGFTPFAAVPLTDTPYVTDVSCTSTKFCVAVGASGGAATWNGTAWTSVQVEGAFSFTSVSCHSTTCAAVDVGGQAFTRSSAGWSAPVALGGSTLSAVSCGTTRYCLTADQNGQVWEWTGTAWASTAAPSGLVPAALSCTGVRTCTAAAEGQVATLSPRGWSRTTTVDPAGGTDRLSCWSATACALFSREGNAVTSA